MHDRTLREIRFQLINKVYENNIMLMQSVGHYGRLSTGIPINTLYRSIQVKNGMRKLKGIDYSTFIEAVRDYIGRGYINCFRISRRKNILLLTPTGLNYHDDFFNRSFESLTNIDLSKLGLVKQDMKKVYIKLEKCQKRSTEPGHSSQY